jgi:predicted GIY-YIG superfamily endonuclease
MDELDPNGRFVRQEEDVETVYDLAEEERKAAADDWLLRMGFGYHVYWMYAADDTLLYVGMTGRLRERLKRHYLTQPWIDEVARIDAEDEYMDKDAAYYAEQMAIRRWRPKYNKTGYGNREVYRP